MENSDVKCGEGHAHLITDIRFRPNSMVFATSSFDRTVMLWDAAKVLPRFSIPSSWQMSLSVISFTSSIHLRNSSQHSQINQDMYSQV